ncbi:MAG: SDR family oxidoreductase [Polyangiaceae bacterium]|nr:SDR family oxidoreductase [Polyangiaceae bacterium]
MSRVVVTGAASGIGRALVTALAKTGRRVLAADITQDGLAKARAEERWSENTVATHFLDVTSDHDWEVALDFASTRFGGIDVLCNVAGVLAPGFVTDINARDCDKQLLINVKGTALGTAAAARRLIAAKNPGHIVNFGSLASLSPVPGLAMYCASKWAVRGFSLSVAVELEPHGIAVTLVCPDAVATPMLDQQMGRDEAALTFSGRRPLTTAEVVDAVIDRALVKRPLEMAIPLDRGLLARAGGIAPAVAQALYPMLKKKGLQGQKRAKQS